MRCTRLVIVLSLFCLYGSVVSSDDDYTPPAFCHDAKCPMFKLLERNDKYELRAYVSTIWAITQLNTTTDEHITQGYIRLRKYLRELVSQGIQVEKTVPITTFIPLCKESTLPYSLAWFLPPELDLRMPSDNKVMIIQISKSKIYVRSFSGIADIEKVQENIQALADALEDQSKPFHASFFGFNSYTSPRNDTDDYNEVFFLAV